ncbi:hypothetical protein A2U01_0036720, partial [Trifolium medium]|nr:hypothetical protein [Trifolium medium]
MKLTMGDQLVETNGRRPPRVRPPPPPAPYVPRYDHFKLILTWPPVYCKVNVWQLEYLIE